MKASKYPIHIFEPFPDGHRFQYVNRLISSLPSDVEILLSTFESSKAHPAYQAIRDANYSNLSMAWIDGELNFRRSSLGKNGLSLQPLFWRLFHRHSRFLNISASNLVLVPYLDYCSYAIGLVGSPFRDAKYAGIVMRPDFHWQEVGVEAPKVKLRFLKKILFRNLLKSSKLVRLVSIDPSLRDWVIASKEFKESNFAYGEDSPSLEGVGDRIAMRESLGISKDENLVLLFGSIDLRKGLRNYLKILSESSPSDKLVGLIAGKVSNSSRELIHSFGLSESRLKVIDRYVTNQEELDSYAAADLVWLAYENFYGPSGVLSQAAKLQKPVIHSEKGVIGYCLRKSSPIRGGWIFRNLKISLPTDLTSQTSPVSVLASSFHKFCQSPGC